MFISVVDVSTISGTPTLTVISKPANGTATVEQRGTVLGISFVASDGNSAPATISYQLSGSGGVDSGIVTMTILDVNDAPVVADDTGLVITGGTISINVLANDYDVDGTITSVAITIPPFAGSASVQPDNSVLFNATGAPPGTYSVGYRVTDDDGATANGVIVISVTDGSGNAYPVAGNDSVSVVSGFVVIAAVLANDTDADGTITAVAIISAPAAGTATVLGDNTIRYDAAPSTGWPASGPNCKRSTKLCACSTRTPIASMMASTMPPSSIRLSLRAGRTAPPSRSAPAPGPSPRRAPRRRGSAPRPA